MFVRSLEFVQGLVSKVVPEVDGAFTAGGDDYFGGRVLGYADHEFFEMAVFIEIEVLVV